MTDIVTAVSHIAEAVTRFIGSDVLASVAALAVIVLFLYIEGGHHSHPSH